MVGAPEGNRNRASGSEDRDVVVRVRCTEKERETIKAEAKVRGLSVSDMLRQMLREEKVLPDVDT